MKGVKGTEIVVSLEDRPGALGEVTFILKQEGINIRAVSGWVEQGKAIIRVVTDDNQKAKGILAPQFRAEEKEVVILEISNEVGKLDSLSSKLKEAEVSMTHIYGTVSGDGQAATLVFATDNNDKAVEAIG